MQTRRNFLKTAILGTCALSVPVWGKPKGRRLYIKPPADTSKASLLEVGEIVMHRPNSPAILIQDGTELIIKAERIIGDIYVQHGSKLVGADVAYFEGEMVAVGDVSRFENNLAAVIL